MNEELQKSYDLVAGEYAGEFQDEMDKKPFDRKMLDWLGEKTGGLGPVCDLGCGPGQAAGYLSARGIAACGIDLSAGMVEEARRLNPGITFTQGDMLNLTGVADDSFGGIAAFYSIIHVPPPKLAQAMKEIYRVLRPGGTALLSFHIGQEIVHRDEWWGKSVAIDFIFLRTAEIKELLKAAGFTLDEVIERDPYPEIEYQSRRGYVFARK